MNWFERNFSKFSITHLTMYLAVGKVMGFLLLLFEAPLYHMLTLDVSAIMSGEVWRLVTFMFIPESLDIWFLFELILFYWFGSSLEDEWGSLKYTLYMLGTVAGVGAAVVLAHFLGWAGTLAIYSVPELFSYALFLPFAWYYGNEEISLMGIVPVKVKYLAIVDALLIIRLFYLSAEYKAVWLVYLLSMLNMVIFFIAVLAKRGKQKARFGKFHQKVRKAERQQKKTTIHRCTVCGITEKDDPNMTFRYCSKCYGDHEYCEKHLADHTHVTNVVEFPQK